MPKRILIFSTNYLPNIGGAEIAIKEITDRMDPQEIEFEMITPRFSKAVPKKEKMGNILVHRGGIGHPIDKFLIKKLGWMRALKLNYEKRFNSIWVMMASHAGFAASWFARLTKKPLVLTLQEGDEESHLKRYVGGNEFLYKILVRPFYTSVFRVADHVTVISEYLKRRAQKERNDVPISIIPNGVDIARFWDIQVEGVGKVKKVLGKKEEDIFLITTSRLAKKNAVDDIVRAMPLLAEHVKLVVIGEGEERRKVEQAMKDFSVVDRVHLLGRVDNSKVPAYLHASDIFIRPSLSEGQGISFIEAMAAGLPIIAPPVGGIVDFLRHQETGMFCQVNNAQSIAQQVKWLLAHPEEKNHIVQNARDLVQEKYDWDDIAEDMLKIFTK